MPAPNYNSLSDSKSRAFTVEGYDYALRAFLPEITKKAPLAESELDAIARNLARAVQLAVAEWRSFLAILALSCRP